MNKLVNWFAGTLTALVIFCGESLSLPALFALASFASALLWLSTQIHIELEQHKYKVDGAPIASAVACSQKFEV